MFTDVSEEPAAYLMIYDRERAGFFQILAHVHWICMITATYRSEISVRIRQSTRHRIAQYANNRCAGAIKIYKNKTKFLV